MKTEPKGAFFTVFFFVEKFTDIQLFHMCNPMNWSYITSLQTLKGTKYILKLHHFARKTNDSSYKLAICIRL